MWRAEKAATSGIAQRFLVVVWVDPQHFHRIDNVSNAGYEPQRPDQARGVEEHEIALRRGVELHYVVHAEAGLESLPHLLHVTRTPCKLVNQET